MSATAKPIDPVQLAVVARAVKSALDSIDCISASVVRLDFTLLSTPTIVGIVAEATRIKALLDLADVYLSFDAGDSK